MLALAGGDTAVLLDGDGEEVDRLQIEVVVEETATTPAPPPGHAVSPACCAKHLPDRSLATVLTQSASAFAGRRRRCGW